MTVRPARDREQGPRRDPDGTAVEAAAMTGERPGRRTARQWRLSRRWRRATLVLHLLSAGAWFGVDVIVAVLVLTGWFASDVEMRSLAYRALAEFVALPMLLSGLLCLVTGLLLGLGTKWGLVRYWWVAVKLTLNLLLCVLILVVLQPGMDAVADYGEQLLVGSPSSGRVRTLFFPPAVSLSALAFATVLAVYKPWGRLRREHGSS
ncbi:hypothetical protein [Actinomadura nitritigenes]|uniref:hypothetical protein n=1 Tax=Actinomadura nitritigenes TaxID=134602 RepID=UPI003D8C6E8B